MRNKVIAKVARQIDISESVKDVVNRTVDKVKAESVLDDTEDVLDALMLELIRRSMSKINEAYNTGKKFAK